VVTDGKTNRQIADEIGVSKTAIRKRLTPEVKKYAETTANGTIYISPEGEALIKQGILDTAQTRFPESSRKPFAEVSGNVSGAFAVLQEQLRVKDSQIAELNRQLHVKDEQIAFLQENATNAQRLHAGTIQKQLTDGEDSGAAVTVVTAPIAQERNLFARIFGRKQ